MRPTEVILPSRAWNCVLTVCGRILCVRRGFGRARLRIAPARAADDSRQDESPPPRQTHLEPGLCAPHVPPVGPLGNGDLSFELCRLLRVGFAQGEELGEGGLEGADVGGWVERCVGGARGTGEC